MCKCEGRSGVYLDKESFLRSGATLRRGGLGVGVRSGGRRGEGGERDLFLFLTIAYWQPFPTSRRLIIASHRHNAGRISYEFLHRVISS